jgi:hypothetical protein
LARLPVAPKITNVQSSMCDSECSPFAARLTLALC